MSQPGSIGRIRSLAVAACSMLAAVAASAQDTINTYAGNSQAAFAGDGGMAVNPALNYPKGVAFYQAGNIYIADTRNFRVRRVTPGGIVTTVAGNGVNAYSGDGGAATAASLSDVTGVAVDPAGNLYIADDSNCRIRKVDANGIIETIAGVGVQGYTGDGGPATAAMLGRPVELAFDTGGNLYYADSVNRVIRKIDTRGIITTVAGNGNGAFAGDGGQAINASINIPADAAIDLMANPYIADAGNHRLREVSPSDALTTVAGTGDNGDSGNGGPGAQTMLNFPWSLAVNASGTVYIGDRVNRGAAYVPVAQVSPGILVVDYTNNTGAILHTSNYSLVTPSNPARPGESLEIYATGLGPVNMAIASGAAAPSVAPFALTVNTPVVTVAGLNASVPFSGLAPKYVGLYQLNITVPSDVQAGTQAVQIKVGGSTSNFVYLAVAQ